MRKQGDSKADSAQDGGAQIAGSERGKTLASHHIPSQNRQVNSTWHHYSSYKSTFSWATFLYILSLRKYVYEIKDNRRKTTSAESEGDFNEEPYIRKSRQKRTKRQKSINLITKSGCKKNKQTNKTLSGTAVDDLFFFYSLGRGTTWLLLTCSTKVQRAEKRRVSPQQILLEPCYIDSSIFALENPAFLCQGAQTTG